MKAQAISLYYRGGTSDKVYNIQLIPDTVGTWGVYAQNGRRGQGLTSRTKVEKVSYSQAHRVFRELVHDKEHHPSTPYEVGPLNGKSAELLPSPVSVVPTSAMVLEVDTPSWPGWNNSLSEAAMLLAVSMPTLGGTTPGARLAFVAAVLVSDLLDGLPEGASEVLALCTKGNAALVDALSPECEAWFDDLDASRKHEVLKFVKENAHLTTV